jgi:hypothetical protein
MPVQQLSPKLNELLALERLGKYVRNHFPRMKVLDADFSIVNAVFQEEIPDRDVTGALAVGTPIGN